jgi:predicted small lipoprotein YifL
MRSALLLVGLVTLAGCGLRQPLEPPPGQSRPPAPAMADRPLTTQEMLTPPPIARPERMGEPLTRSEPRRGDRFDLPPADVPAGDDPTDPDDEDDQPE